MSWWLSPFLSGQTLTFLQEHSSGKHQNIPEHVLYRIRSIYQQSRNISTMSLPYLQRDNKEYYEKLSPLVDRPSMVLKEYRLVDHKLLWDSTQTKSSGQ